MIQNSFIFLDRVGYKTEQRLWEQSILEWKDFLETRKVEGISSRYKRLHDKELEFAEFNLRNRIPHYFSHKLKTRDHWRLYDEFKDRACYLDIETTGLSPYHNEITAVGIFDGEEVKSFVKGINLQEGVVKEELSKYSMVVTYYGSAFDFPFISHQFPSVRFSMPHFDLCFAGRRVGLKGGLKCIEQELGIERNEEIKDVDGLEAVRLWHRWERFNNEASLEKLIKYNQSDVINLKDLAEIIYGRLKEKTFKVRI